ncbi:MAG: hypothetical protein ACLS3U_08340 [Lachnospiraceae bacterium]
MRIEEIIYVSCYRSQNLTIKFRNHSDDKFEDGRLSRAYYAKANQRGWKKVTERPKVLYNKKTNKFVMWAHFEMENYLDAAVAIATCDTPDGDFTYHGHFNPYGYMSRDCTLIRKRMELRILFLHRDNADLHVYRLSDDYMNVDCLVHRLWQGEYREAPAVIKGKYHYYMISSFCTGWAPNQGKYAWADSIEGRWSSLKEIGDETTYDSQSAFLLNVNGKLVCRRPLGR